MSKSAKFLLLLAGRFVGLLDQFSGAVAAYSLRSLSASTTNVVKVRRSGDDAELDFTATEVSGGTLASWVTAGGGTEDGFVTTWYDQSGNGYNATRVTAAGQPKIVDSGSLVTENGKAAIDFDGTNDSLVIGDENSIQAGTNSISIIALISPENFTNDPNIFFGARAFNTGWLAGFSVDPYPFFRMFNVSEQFIPAPFSSVTATTGQQLYTALAPRGATGNYYKNSTLLASTTSPVGTATMENSANVRIGSYEDNSANAFGLFTGTIQEIIVYTSDQSANRTRIEGNINGYYNIFS